MAENEVLVKVEGLSKKFCKDLKTSLWYGVKDLFSNLRGNKEIRELRDKEFWAVKDISFELRRGECLGLIGHNGAGKSTLLKILNGLMMPDAGKVTMKGRVGALIELGAGFNPILSGRENIYNNGAILGFTRKEINEKVEEIIDFAEIRDFIDMPVKNYSSGMTVRLGFAIAAQMEPDILLIDEVLAVGDLGFVLKCFRTIDRILPKTAIIFVSHNMPMVSRICSQILVLKNGVSLFQGENVSKGLDLYYMQFSKNESNLIYSDGSIRINDFKLLGLGKEDIPKIKWGDNLLFELRFELSELNYSSILLNVIFLDKEQRAIGRTSDKLTIDENQNFYNISIKIPSIKLSKGVYNIDVLFLNPITMGPIFRMNGLKSFQVLHELDIWEPFLLDTVIEYKL